MEEKIQISIRVPVKLLKESDRMAEAMGVTRSEVLVMAMKDGIKTGRDAEWLAGTFLGRLLMNVAFNGNKKALRRIESIVGDDADQLRLFRESQ